MNINYKQPQFELFPANSATLEDVNKPRFLLANLNLSMENLVILVILGIMVALFSFSWGAEHGKRLAAQALDERVSAAWNVTPRKAAAAVPAAKPAMGTPVAAKSAGNAGFVMRQPQAAVAAKPVAAKPVAVKPVAVKSAAIKPAPVKAVVPAAAAAIAAAKPARYTVQMATYKSEEYAKQAALDLRAKGLPTFLIKKADFWLLCAGQFISAESAEGLSKRLEAKFRGLIVRRI